MKRVSWTMHGGMLTCVRVRARVRMCICVYVRVSMLFSSSQTNEKASTQTNRQTRKGTSAPTNKHTKSKKKSSKWERNGSQNRRKSVPGELILGVLASSGASWGASAEKWCPRGGQNAAKMGQDAPKDANLSEHGGQVGAKMAL